jgi:NAD dependent epimerase/dehydratase family enzyme
MPTFALRLALGEGANVLLEGQRVIPEHALGDGYSFRFSSLEPALSALLK